MLRIADFKMVLGLFVCSSLPYLHFLNPAVLQGLASGCTVVLGFTLLSVPNAFFFVCVCVCLAFCVLSSPGHGSVAGTCIEVPEASCLLYKRGRERWHKHLVK